MSEQPRTKRPRTDTPENVASTLTNITSIEHEHDHDPPVITPDMIRVLSVDVKDAILLKAARDTKVDIAFLLGDAFDDHLKQQEAVRAQQRIDDEKEQEIVREYDEEFEAVKEILQDSNYEDMDPNIGEVPDAYGDILEQIELLMSNLPSNAGFQSKQNAMETLINIGLEILKQEKYADWTFDCVWLYEAMCEFKGDPILENSLLKIAKSLTVSELEKLKQDNSFKRKLTSLGDKRGECFIKLNLVLDMFFKD